MVKIITICSQNNHIKLYKIIDNFLKKTHISEFQFAHFIENPNDSNCEYTLKEEIKKQNPTHIIYWPDVVSDNWMLWLKDASHSVFRASDIDVHTQNLTEDVKYELFELFLVLKQLSVDPTELTQTALLPKCDDHIGKMLLMGSLKTHPVVRDFNARWSALKQSVSSKTLIVEQHLSFICHQLFDFIQSVDRAKKAYVLPFNYGRYYRKSDWQTVPIPLDDVLTALHGPKMIDWTTDMPAGVREHGILFFTFKDQPDHYYVLFKPDVQISKANLSRHLYASGSTKVVKYALLFDFIYRTNDCFINKIEDVVTFTRPTTISENTSKTQELSKLIEQKDNEFINWTKISFKRNLADSDPTLLLYQKHEGDRVINQKVKNCETVQKRLYACLTFLSSVKQMLQSGYWPVDLKYENMCQKSIDTPNGLMTKLTVIDFLACGSTYSLFKRLDSTIPFHGLQMPIDFEEYTGILKRLNYRGHDINGTVVQMISDRSFAYLVRQLMFEIFLNLMNIYYQAFFSTNIMGCFNQFFLKNQTLSWTFKYQKLLYFCTDIHKCIYYEFDDTKLPFMYWVYYWNRIKCTIEQIYALYIVHRGNINNDPILGSLYASLFSEAALQEWYNLMLNFRSTQSPFGHEKNQVVNLIPV